MNTHPEYGYLVDSNTTERVRAATESEYLESYHAGPEGHIMVGERRCYVEGALLTAEEYESQKAGR